jgi:hypothetical protein
VYKPSLKRGKARLCAEVPNCTEAEVLALLGSNTASNGKKQVGFWSGVRKHTELPLPQETTATATWRCRLVRRCAHT